MGTTGREILTASVEEAEHIQSAMREPMRGEHTGGARFTWHAHQFELGEVRRRARSAPIVPTGCARKARSPRRARA